MESQTLCLTARPQSLVGASLFKQFSIFDFTQTFYDKSRNLLKFLFLSSMPKYQHSRNPSPHKFHLVATTAIRIRLRGLIMRQLLASNQQMEHTSSSVQTNFLACPRTSQVSHSEVSFAWGVIFQDPNRCAWCLYLSLPLKPFSLNRIRSTA